MKDEIDIIDIKVTAFIQGYAKCMADVEANIEKKVGYYFDIGKATDEFKKNLEAKK